MTSTLFLVYRQQQKLNRIAMVTAFSCTSAVGDVSSLEELLQCPICLDTFTDPKWLDCHHTFCEKCLQGVHSGSGQSRHVRCPACRRTTSVPANGIAGLPDDFRANEIKDKIRQIKTRNRHQGNVSFLRKNLILKMQRQFEHQNA